MENKPDVMQRIKEVIKRHSNSSHTHYCGDEAEEIASLLNHYEHKAASCIAEKKQLIEDVLVYLRSVVMITETVGMAGTHAEKSARLRGLVDLLNSAIKKLRNEQTEDILNNWESFSWGFSDYPYRGILDQYQELKRENAELKKMLNSDKNPERSVETDAQ